MYVLISLLLLGVALLIRFVIRPAIRNGRAASDLAQFTAHLATMATPFALGDGETITSTFVGRDLGAIRKVVGESATEDTYPASFPLIFTTTKRLIVLMSTNDRPTAVSGSYPVAQPNIHRRIGEQFNDLTGRVVSSAGWLWETIGMVVADGRDVGLSWTDREGVGVVLLNFGNVSDQARFVNQAIAAIRERRGVVALHPAEPKTEVEGTQTTFTFANPLVSCARCGAEVADGDRFCTGCGSPVARMEHA